MSPEEIAALRALAEHIDPDGPWATMRTAVPALLDALEVAEAELVRLRTGIAVLIADSDQRSWMTFDGGRVPGSIDHRALRALSAGPQ